MRSKKGYKNRNKMIFFASLFVVTSKGLFLFREVMAMEMPKVMAMAAMVLGAVPSTKFNDAGNDNSSMKELFT